MWPIVVAIIASVIASRLLIRRYPIASSRHVAFAVAVWVAAVVVMGLPGDRPFVTYPLLAVGATAGLFLLHALRQRWGVRTL